MVATGGLRAVSVLGVGETSRTGQRHRGAVQGLQ